MSLALINDLFVEVRRLSIAGIKFAKDDFRLKNSLDEIAKIRGSSAVMQRLYSAGNRVLESADNELPDNFFEFSNLVTAVMATQADNQVSGDLKDIHNIPLAVSHEISYRSLYPVMESLTKTGSGRAKIIGEYLESGLPVDFRLIDMLIKSLNGYTEIADYAREILKKADSCILPLIEQSFNAKGNRGDGRKLELIYHFARDQKKELFTEVLICGSSEVRDSAIKILLHFKDGEKIIKEYGKRQDKNLKEHIEGQIIACKKEDEAKHDNNFIGSILGKIGITK
jgi:hypothetical protein